MVFDERFWVAVSFVALVVLVFKPLRKTITTALDGRSSQIQKELDEAVRLKEEAEDILVSYKKKQKEVLEDAKHILEHAEKEVARITREAHDAMDVELSRRKELALQKIASYEARVLEEIRNNAVDSAIDAVYTLAEQHMDKNAANVLVEQSISNVSKKIH